MTNIARFWRSRSEVGTWASLVAMATGLGLSACGGGAGAASAGAIAPQDRSGISSTSGQAVSKQAALGYKKALDEFVQHDQSFDWSDGSCRRVAKGFIDASEQQVNDGGKPLPEALYNAGLAYMRCGVETEAVAQYRAAQAADSNFHRATAQMTLFEFQKTENLDRAIGELEEVIRAAKFQNAEALVSLAALQMRRGSEVASEDGKDDFERARKNIQRALAIDDSYMPAFNQLAIYYLELAKQKSGHTAAERRRGLVVAGAQSARVNQQMLELAALVASQAVRKNPSYAPIHNTSGLIQVELQNFNGSVKNFGQARRLDPKFFEAHMNYAAVSLSFRGFKEAEAAYRDALKFAPDDYEANLGLALALRGQINDANFDQQVAETQKHLDRCKTIDQSRPEAFYNEAILTQEYKAKGSQEKTIPALEKAVDIYREFITKAGGDSTFEEAVKRSKERSQDIQDTVKFIREGEVARQQAEEDAKLRKIQEKEEAARLKEEQARQKAEDERLAKEAAQQQKAQKAATAAAPAPPGAQTTAAPPGQQAPAPVPAGAPGAKPAGPAAGAAPAKPPGAPAAGAAPAKPPAAPAPPP